MDALTAFFLLFTWTLIAFLAGILTYWFATRKQRQLLKRYRQREQERRWLNRPIE